MTRTEIIQVLINKTNGKNYLEIGMGPGTNFSQIQCENKVCVDPTPTVPVTFTLTSDEFFKQNKDKFDVVFIDGLHWSEQVYKDIINKLGYNKISIVEGAAAKEKGKMEFFINVTNPTMNSLNFVNEM